MSQTKTVVKLYVYCCTTKAKLVEELLDTSAVAKLEEKIQHLIDSGLATVGETREQLLHQQSRGDDAAFAFECPNHAHNFAQAVHKETINYNSGKTFELAKIWFRVGVANGELDVDKMTGKVMIAAARLETAAQPGELLIDKATFDKIDEQLKDNYEPGEIAYGKQEGEKYSVRRWKVVPKALFLELILKNNEILSQAINKYEDNSQSIKKRFDILNNYKLLHDGFQNLEVLIETFKNLGDSSGENIDQSTVNLIVVNDKILRQKIESISEILDLEKVQQELGKDIVSRWKSFS